MRDILIALRMFFFCDLGFHRPSHSTWRDEHNMIRANCLICKQPLVLTHENRWIRSA